MINWLGYSWYLESINRLILLIGKAPNIFYRLNNETLLGFAKFVFFCIFRKILNLDFQIR